MTLVSEELDNSAIKYDRSDTLLRLIDTMGDNETAYSDDDEFNSTSKVLTLNNTKIRCYEFKFLKKDEKALWIKEATKIGRT